MATNEATDVPEEIWLSDNNIGLILAVSSSIFIGASFIIKKKGLRLAGTLAAAQAHAMPRPLCSWHGAPDVCGLRPRAAGSGQGALRAGAGGYSYLLQPMWWAGEQAAQASQPSARVPGGARLSAASHAHDDPRGGVQFRGVRLRAGDPGDAAGRAVDHCERGACGHAAQGEAALPGRAGLRTVHRGLHGHRHPRAGGAAHRQCGAAVRDGDGARLYDVHGGSGRHRARAHLLDGAQVRQHAGARVRGHLLLDRLALGDVLQSARHRHQAHLRGRHQPAAHQGDALLRGGRGRVRGHADELPQQGARHLQHRHRLPHLLRPLHHPHHLCLRRDVPRGRRAVLPPDALPRVRTAPGRRARARAMQLVKTLRRAVRRCGFVVIMAGTFLLHISKDLLDVAASVASAARDAPTLTEQEALAQGLSSLYNATLNAASGRTPSKRAAAAATPLPA
eukprot:scaffold195_cov359-Prasinococcus_capsulatus_cf.AAC.5